MEELSINEHALVCESKKFTRLASCRIKITQPIFKTEMLIDQG